MAAFFRPHHHYTVPEPNFQGLFRLIDDFDRYSTQDSGSNSKSRQNRNNVSVFTPKFDMRETETAYELHGELAGIAKEDINIEFTDPQTLHISGKIERTHTAGTPPAGLIGSDSGSKGAITGGSDEHTETSSSRPHSPHRATVEDDPEEKGNSKSSDSTPQDTPASTVVEAAKPEQPKQEVPKHKYYLIERNVGSFSRSFNFPSRIDSETVQASLNNGILTVTVQKAKKHESRRIAIN